MFGYTKDSSGEAVSDDDCYRQNQVKEVDNKHISFLRWINPFITSISIPKTETVESNSPCAEEFRGVQSLKQLWNNRISAIKDTRQKSATLGGAYSKSASIKPSLSLSKSVSCLVSSHLEHSSINSSQADARTHVDNFYKYKTAASRKRASLSAAGDLKCAKPNFSNKEQKTKVQKVASFGANFPLIASTETGEKIHWAKREDIFINRKQKQNCTNTETELACTKSQSTNNFITYDKAKLSSCNIRNIGSDMAIKSSENTISTPTVRIFDKTDTSKSHDGSANCLSSDSPMRKKLSSTPRKYSFKTHAKNYYTPRKMATNVGRSKVAALTHQFNQMIQKDAAILEEVKKKNGVLMTRAGHVYKIKEETEIGKKKVAKKGTSEDDSKGNKKRVSIKNKPSPKNCKDDVDETRAGTVRAAIEKFESQDKENVPATLKQPPAKPVLQKPKVPHKSEQVLQRTKEIAIRNSQKRIKISNGDSKSEIPSPVLEKIKEEVKTPQEEVVASDEKSTEVRDKTENKVPDITNTSNIDSGDETQARKHKYARLYEKFLVRSHFSSSKSSNDIKSPTVPLPHRDQPPEQKIIDALETVNKKLEHLSKSTNDIRDKSDDEKLYEEMVANMKPNDSFLFRRNYKNAFMPSEEDKSSLVEAVNIPLINKTQSMDETRFPSFQMRQISLEEREYPNILKHTDELLNRLKGNIKSEEDGYEPLSIHCSQPKDHNEKEMLIQMQLTPREGNERKVPEAEESIYQTVPEIRQERIACDSINSYESYDNYESVPDELGEDARTYPMQTEDGYEICDPPEPPPPRRSEHDIHIALSQAPALPLPKRIISNTFLLPQNSEKAPPRPPKSPKVRRTELPEIPLMPPEHFDTNNCDEIHDYDEENIYDTIKSSESASHCYEILGCKNPPKSMDTESVTSNCYESINSFRRVPVLRHSDSVSTLSSEQKTNSLYGITLGRNSPPSNEAYSDNSDEWVDISDGEEGDAANAKHHFIVVRERAKCHRSPVWSKRVRDQRIHQQTADYFDDDSDHYYEPLLNTGHSNQNISTSGAVQTLIDNCRPQLTPLILPDITYQQNAGENSYSDDYDSFDSDEDTDEDVKKHDSGVDLDISNAKLPDPPPTTNQVYAFVKKFKNLISIKKTSTSSRTAENSGKSYENTQFYVGIGTDYQNVNSNDASKSQKQSKVRTPKTLKRTPKQASNSDDPYENTEFHTPRTPISTPVQVMENNSVPYSTPVANQVEVAEGTVPFDLMNRKKSKSGKSFKSKLRKSLAGPDTSLNIGGTLSGTRSTFYISDSVDVDSGIFEKTLQSDSNSSQVSTGENVEKIKSATVTRKNKKSVNTPDLNRRKTTIGIRPNNPPPPPPTEKKLQKKRTSTTSWYAECGVFKANSNISDDLLSKSGQKERSSSTSWYAEAGLYQTSGASVASSSGSSGVSTGGEGGPSDENTHSMFLNEPLYQIYSAAKLESISRDMEDQDSTDGYEEIGSLGRSDNSRKPLRPSALQLVGPKQGPSRTLWSEIPEVINSEILATLTSTERRLQEAKFEILTSEASYLKSLNLLKTHFMNHPAFRDAAVLSPSDRKTLFSHIVPVHECSDRLLSDLENCWQDNIMLLGLSKSLYKHAEKYFHVYISFCEHQGKMDRMLRRLKEAKGAFNQTLEMLETDPICCGLNLHSFLMLPMQRITRLPLLIDAVFSKVKPDDDEYEDWKMTLSILNKIVAQCNEAAHRCEQAYEIERISRQIEFPSNIRSVAIAPVGVPAQGTKPRALVKRGELVHLIWRGDDAKLTFGKKFTKCNIYAFLFTDLLVLTKRKGEEVFSVFDYCQRSMLTVSSGETIPQLPTKEISQAGRNFILMTLLENHEGKTVEMILSCPSVSEQQRWLQATAPPSPENPGEKLYEQWDCPQVIAKHEFCATEPDLLSLEPGDVVNVTRKMADGWYQGERIRDGATGWFPGNFTEEVNSPHVRARNLKQRYRLLTFTASYLEAKKHR